MPARRPPFRYYVVLVPAKSKKGSFKSAAVKKSREAVTGAIYDHDLREYALDFQKLHNQKLRNARKRTENLVRVAHAALMGAAPAFKEYAKKKLVDDAVNKRRKVLEGVVS